MIRDGRLGIRVGGCIVLSILFASLPARAQQEPTLYSSQPAAASTESQRTSTAQKPNPQGPGKPQSAEQTKEQQNTAKEETTGTSNDRLFFTLPNFLTIENASQVPPLSSAEKFKVVARSSFDYVEYPWFGFLAAVSQAQNSEPGYGQGWEAYGKRFGAAFGDGTIENFWTGAILPSLLHQDPRYYEMGASGGRFWHRTGYAVSRIFVTRTDSGGEAFNASEIFGAAISAGISTYAYHPRSDKTLRNTASVWGSSIGYDTVTVIVKEFWPDIRRKLRGNKGASAPAQGP